ncbi:putative p60 katanin [Neospora caninum Liverpool]|uniref:Putative p60 katanin n=1 Tax=Neospora caninum (strain Liverpool) TaxID=572307 RepID=F0VEI1_NEOCL|nr:putative p60 katanin [Neospora caninum Liverpool]CBZ52125.1 putative p60 katanin [Neospora caninum Liverpool]|eukprot:XP_003882157.1 putative p60 katanin [Neospora caninum Liverpool]
MVLVCAGCAGAPFEKFEGCNVELSPAWHTPVARRFAVCESERTGASSLKSKALAKTGAVAAGCGGWLKHTDRGRVFLSQRDQRVVVIEGNPAAFCVATYEGPPAEKARQATGRFCLNAVLEASPSGQRDGQALYLVFDLRQAGDVTGACDFCALHLNCSTREYRVESYGAGGNLRVLQTVSGVTALQPHHPFSVRLLYHADVIRVDINETQVTTNLHVGRWPSLPLGNSAYTRGVGVGVYGRTRALISKFWISSECPALRVPEHLLGCSLDSLTTRPIICDECLDPPVPYAKLEEQEIPQSDSDLVAMIEQDILRESLHVPFDDVAGLTHAKRLLKEAVVLPSLFPELFQGVRQPWKGFLLFGPPGTGKTLLAKAVASATQWTFFTCSLATLTSKWRGESEKLVRVLFQMARTRAPSILFFDEIDALLTKRGTASEHEASRRTKSELLIQLDGLATGGRHTKHRGPEEDAGAGGVFSNHVMVLATSNTPWDIDEAFRRRLEKRIYIPLPGVQAREDMLRIHLDGIPLADGIDLKAIANRTEQFSGADLQHLCREACMNPLRRVFDDLALDEIKAKRAAGAFVEEETRVTMADFDQALEKANPSTHAAEIAKFERWNAEFGSR